MFYQGLQGFELDEYREWIFKNTHFTDYVQVGNYSLRYRSSSQKKELQASGG